MNEPQFPPSFGGDLTAPPLPPHNPSWIEKLKLTLFEDRHFAPYQAPAPLTTYQQYKAQTLFTAFSHLSVGVLRDDTPHMNLLWGCDIVSRNHILNPVAQTKLHAFLDQLPLLLNWHKNASTRDL